MRHVPVARARPLVLRQSRCLIYSAGSIRCNDSLIRAKNSSREVSPRPGSSVVERGPEKAGVGGSIPSLATTYKINSFGFFCAFARGCVVGPRQRSRLSATLAAL